MCPWYVVTETKNSPYDLGITESVIINTTME